jgi:hypothetical protein
VVASVDTLFRAPVWYPDAPDVAHGQTVPVPPGGSKALSVVVG